MEGANPITDVKGSGNPRGLAPAEPKERIVAPAAPAATHDRVVTPRKIMVLAIIALAAIAYGVLEGSDTWKGWLGLAKPATALVVSGNIEAHESVLGFKTVQSRIVELPFDEGQWVKAGTLVAKVDDGDYRQQAAIAEAALAVQQSQLAAAEQNLIAAQKTVVSDQANVEMKKLDNERYQTLWRQGYTPTQTRDQAATAYRQSRAASQRDEALALVAERNIGLAKANVHDAEESLGLARIVLGYTTLVAPFDGVILVRQAELGEIAMPGTAIATLANLDHVWLRAYINETDISRVRFGAAAAITTDTYPGKVYHGRISFISPSAEFTPKTVETHAERVTLVYRIKIDIDNPTHELVPGMPADAAIELPRP